MMRVCLTYRVAPASPPVPHLLICSPRKGWFPFLFPPLAGAFLSWDGVHLPASKVAAFWTGSSGALVINNVATGLHFKPSELVSV